MEETILTSGFNRDFIQRTFESDLVIDSRENPSALLSCDSLYVSSSYGDHRSKHKYYSKEEHQSLIDGKCDELYAATGDLENHAQRLDEIFSTIVECEWRPKAVSSEEIVQTTEQVLSRMPLAPLELPDLLDSLPLVYFSGPERSWKSLKVVTFPCKNFLRVMFYGASTARGGFIHTVVQELLNVVAEVIDTVVLRSKSTRSKDESQRMFLIRAFLWSFWQRARTCFIYFFLRSEVRWGFEQGNWSSLWCHNFEIAPEMSVSRLSESRAEDGRAVNMCSWAFRLLRTDAAAVGLDFRLFHDRFFKVFDHIPARCQEFSDRPCAGDHYSTCLRFVGQHVKDQSAHDPMCTSGSDAEARLRWDEASYTATNGSRAVSLRDTDVQSGLLRYCEASERTLAISHVWSHGQGGRPETGINSCLHSRYDRIATTLDCDSYWMDTTCIPTTHKLRREAIGHINETFYKCRAVLVCDKDIMTVDVTNMSIQLQESLLVASLMCDWNIRAWTILEATKGREKVFLLCKDDRTVDFRKLLYDVYHYGNIALSVFSIFAPHMFPSMGEGRTLSQRQIENGWTDIPLGVVGTWLSYRPASRPGDDMVIWSLLLAKENGPCSNEVDFWQSRVGQTLPTGFLISSAPRLKSSGLSWAPKSPFAAPKTLKKKKSAKLAEFIRPSNGLNTEVAKVTKDGLEGPWLVYRFCSRMENLKIGVKDSFKQQSSKFSSPLSPLDKELDRIRQNFLSYHIHGALLRPIFTMPHSHLDGIGRLRDYVEQGTLVVVCGSSDRDWNNDEIFIPWKWKGVYKWPVNVELPAFERIQDFWIR